MAVVHNANKQMPAGFTLQAFDHLGSTNDEAMRQAREGAENGLVIWAKEQSQGRGRRGRQWVSSKGNLFLSVYVKRNYPLPRMAELSFLSSIAMRETLDALIETKGRILHKWPNDLLLDGSKLSGILLEVVTIDGHAQGVIIGTGVNIDTAPTPALYPTICLRDVLGDQTIDLEDIIVSYSHHLQKWLSLWDTEGFLPVRQGFLDYAKGKGEAIIARLADGNEISGVFEDLGHDGALSLRMPDGKLRLISAGDIFFV